MDPIEKLIKLFSSSITINSNKQKVESVKRCLISQKNDFLSNHKIKKFDTMNRRNKNV